jgi:hypothetical protein
MSEAINMHKRIAMGGESEANHLKKGGKVKKYAKGGQVEFEGTKSKQPGEVSHQKNVNKIGAYPEKVIRNLPAKGNVTPYEKTIGKIATMKKGGKAKGGLSVMIAVGKPMKKAAGRGR